jgi:hypothetical protein
VTSEEKGLFEISQPDTLGRGNGQAGASAIETIWDDVEFMLPVILLGFSIIIFIMLIISGSMKLIDSKQFGVIAIIFFVMIFSLFLIAAGWSEKTIAPAFSLLGAIVGFLLGNSSATSPSTNNVEDKSSNKESKTL